LEQEYCFKRKTLRSLGRWVVFWRKFADYNFPMAFFRLESVNKYGSKNKTALGLVTSGSLLRATLIRLDERMKRTHQVPKTAFEVRLLLVDDIWFHHGGCPILRQKWKL
jgi:hypothetical protein